MKNICIKIITAAALLAFGIFVLTGCSSSTNGGTASDSKDTIIKVGATASPHAEILEFIKDDLAKEGYTLEIAEYNDYILPNTAVDQGEIDANYFQHIAYLDDFNDKNGTNIESVADIHYEPFAIYSEQLKNLKDIKDGATIAIPNDPTNEARALLLLQDQGVIKLKDGVSLEATQLDIIENPKNIKFKEIEAAQAVLALPDVAAAVINGNYALKAGLDIDDALVVEVPNADLIDAYKNVLAVKGGNEGSPKIQALVKALTSEKVKQFIASNYSGNGQAAVISVF